jgi:type II secretory pathway component PulF
MPTFEYKAKTRTGEMVSGTLAAGDRKAALSQLGRMGYFPLRVEGAGETAKSQGPAARTAGGRGGGRVSTRDVLMFSQQLSSLLRSGMTLSQALDSLQRRSARPRLKALLAQLREDIVQGASLSDALAKHPKTFSPFYVNLVRAGEASGALDEVMLRLVKHYEQLGELRDRVVAAMIYPTIMFFGCIGTIMFFMTVMVPKFAQMFKEMGRTMPLPTRVLIGTSEVVTAYWWIGALILVLLVLLYRQRMRTPEGPIQMDALKLRLPVFGGIIMASAFAQFARTLATLLENGVPVLNALQIVENTMTNRLIAAEIREARTRVTDGTSISQPLATGKIFPPLLIDMLAVGEESGEVVPALQNIADTYEQELSRTLKIFTSLLEPAIIIVMAVVVGAIVLSILLAVFDITSGIGK